MFDERELRKIWYEGEPPGGLLICLGGVFGALGALRRRMYAWGLLPRRRLPLPVVVVGNISVGGTGKTPLVIALVEGLRARGFRPGVISRGYAGSARQALAVDARSDPALVGDEARLIFDTTGAPVQVGRDRAAAGSALLQRHNEVDVLIADDGLQHYKLCRNVEICVIDGERRLGNGRLLPAGPLREPTSRLDAVDFLVCNGGEARPQDVRMLLRGDEAIALADPGARRALADFAGQRVHAVAGIGNPQRFFTQLRVAGIDVIEHAFPDHHPFVPAELDFGDTLDVLMTPKDAVKCLAFARERQWQVPVRAELPGAFFDAVAVRLKKVRAGD